MSFRCGARTATYLATLSLVHFSLAACQSDSGSGPSGSFATGGSAQGCVGTQCAGSGGDVMTGSGGGDGVGTGGGLPTFECPQPSAGLGLEVGLAPAEVGGASLKMHLNHVGYELLGSKQAVIEASANLTSFQVVRESDDRVFFEGSLTAVPNFAEFESKEQHYVADFSDLHDAGTYVLRVNGESSPSFLVGAGQLFKSTMTDVLGFFRQSRADEADSDIWNADQSVELRGGGGEDDVRGGWYDASGDLSKYLSHLSYANFMNPQQIPLTAWALAWASSEAAGPFSTQGLADDVRQEALWGADYLVRAQNDSGFFYITVFDGWSGEPEDREICAFTGSEGMKTPDYQAAFREGGGMSIAALARASQLGANGAFTSADYLKAAEDGFAHLQSMNLSYVDDGKENIIDDYTALMAAAELYDATSKPEYLTAARSRAQKLIARLHEQGYFIADDGDRPFFHAADAGLPVIALTRYAELEAEGPEKSAALQAMQTHLTYLMSVTNQTANPFGYARQHFKTGGAVRSGFFIPHDNETGYWWQGESARLGSLAAAAILGGRALSNQECGQGVGPELASFAANQVDWILGKNPFDVSMMAGHGRNNPPTYCSVKEGHHGHHNGGISNGITGSNTDGSGIQWRSPNATGEDCWEDWRWVEQWLPHATWYLVAVTAMAQGQ